MLLLWGQPFFEAMHRALKPGGVISTQVRRIMQHGEWQPSQRSQIALGVLMVEHQR